MIAEALIIVAYLGIGGAVLSRWGPTDSECSYLNLNPNVMAARYAREFRQSAMPRRMPFRLPAEYWLYAWTHRLWLARVAALTVGGVGVWVAMQYAAHLASPTAGVLAGVIILSSPYTVGMLGTASYVAPVATLWVGGLYAVATGHPVLATAIAAVLALLRASSWGMAGVLWFLAGGWAWVTAAAVIGYLLLYHWPVIRAQGWVRLALSEPCPVQGIPRDGWGYAIRIAATRFEAWWAWGLAALTLGVWSTPAYTLMLLTISLFAATHLPRALIRPKWILGYVPDFVLPMAVALAVALAPR